jgi:hypothetical protein
MFETFIVHTLNSSAKKQRFIVPTTLAELTELSTTIANAYGMADTHTAVIYIEDGSLMPIVARLVDIKDKREYLVEFELKSGGRCAFE